MAGEAQQLSFIQGEISPEYHLRSDLASFNSSLSKAVNVKLEPLGGISNRLGTIIQGPVPAYWGGDFSPILKGSHSYKSVIFQHYITGRERILQVFDNNGAVEIYIDNSRADLYITGLPGLIALPLRGDILNGIKGLHFIVHNDLIIFSKTIPVLIDKNEIDPAYLPYLLPIPGEVDKYYTETQLCIRMLPDGSDRIEANLTLQNGIFENTTVGLAQTSKPTPVIGTATYIVMGETAEGVDIVLGLMNSIPGINMPLNNSVVINDVIPFPVNNNCTNVLTVTGVTSEIISYGTRTISKLKVYRAAGKNVSFNGLYKLVAQFNVGGAISATVTDTGQEEAAYTSCSDTSALYRQPSMINISSDVFIHLVVGGLKTVVDTAIFQQRAYYAINKGKWHGTSVYNNTIVASRINSPSQVIYPQITNPREAFQFNVPEEAGGFLTHLASMSRLVAFTNTSTFVIQGDEAGIITPTSINPYKVLTFGCAEGIPPAISGETCLFANTDGGVGYVNVNSEGQVVAGVASALSNHLFKNKTILSIESAGDRKSLPKFIINTEQGDVIVCYKVGDFFSFFPLEIEGVTLGTMLREGEMLSLTRVLSPIARNRLWGAGSVINIKKPNEAATKDTVLSMHMPIDAKVNTTLLDFTSSLDLSTFFGSNVFFDEVPPTGFARWIYYKMHIVEGPPGSDLTYLTDASGNWEPHTPIKVQGNNVKLDFVEDSTILGAERIMRFFWLEDGVIVSAYAEIVEEIGPVPAEYYFIFREEIPLKLREGISNLNLGFLGARSGDMDVERELKKGTIFCDRAFKELHIPWQGETGAYARLHSQCLIRGIDVTNKGTLLVPFEIPVTIESNGNIYGNYKDPTETVPVILRHYAGTVGVDDPYFEIALPEYATFVTIGVPAIAEVETLPIASIEQDLTDANKNINYVSVLMYETQGIRVGEVGQPNEYLEKFDFTTEDSVDTPAKFTGAKSYNFSSSWNEHGKIRVSGIDLQPFTISGIIPKGNVGGF